MRGVLRSGGSAAALALALSLSGAPARADDDDETTWARSQGGRIGLELDVLSRGIKRDGKSPKLDGKALGVAFTGVAQVELFNGFHVDAEVPFSYGKVSLSGSGAPKSSQSGVALGDPTVGVHFASNLSPTLAMFGGVAVAIPIVRNPSADVAAAAAATLPARAYFDMHRLLLGYLSFLGRFGVEARLIEVLEYRGDVTAMIALPTEGGGRQVVIEQGNELALRTPIGVGVGLRFQEAFPLSTSDLLQTAAEPFVDYEPSESGLFARAGLLVALDKQLGFGLDQGKVATARLAVGGKF